jgi:hypothetical protein
LNEPADPAIRRLDLGPLGRRHDDQVVPDILDALDASGDVGRGEPVRVRVDLASQCHDAMGGVDREAVAHIAQVLVQRGLDFHVSESSARLA